jgi:hypothetical protein
MKSLREEIAIIIWEYSSTSPNYPIAMTFDEIPKRVKDDIFNLVDKILAKIEK